MTFLAIKLTPEQWEWLVASAAVGLLRVPGAPVAHQALAELTAQLAVEPSYRHHLQHAAERRAEAA